MTKSRVPYISTFTLLSRSTPKARIVRAFAFQGCAIARSSPSGHDRPPGTYSASRPSRTPISPKQRATDVVEAGSSYLQRQAGEWRVTPAAAHGPPVLSPPTGFSGTGARQQPPLPKGVDMAARTNKVKLTTAWREKIRTSMLINRLQNHVAGRIEMSSTQLRAAEILLRKNLPDLQAVVLSGDPDNPIVTRSSDLIFDKVLQRAEEVQSLPH